MRDVRSTALRLLAAVWQRYPGMADFNPLWPRFFRVTAPILERLPTEVSAEETWIRVPPAWIVRVQVCKVGSCE